MIRPEYGLSGKEERDTVGAMLTRKIYRGALLLGLTLSVASSVVGCKGAPETKTADHISAGAMPEGGDWNGVFYNQNLGFLHLTVSGNSAQGAWRTEAGDKWGELYGTVDGNMIRYSWTERKVGIVGPAAKSEGKGYFLYSLAGVEGEAHELHGEWGLGEDEIGQPWNCLKQMNREPDPKSVRPNEMESRVGASGFDGAKGDEDLKDQENPHAADAKKERDSDEPSNDPL